MKYLLTVNSRAEPGLPADDRHQKLIAHLIEQKLFWGTTDDIPTVFPGFGKEFTATAELRKYLAKGIKMTAMYRYRNMLEDHHSCDDRIWIEFNAKKIDFAHLVTDIFPGLLSAFGAYEASIYNEAIIYKDFEASGRMNYRKDIYRIFPVVFYDKDLCKTAFGMSPSSIVQKLQGYIHSASIKGNGVLIIGDTKPLTMEEHDEFDARIKKLLGYHNGNSQNNTGKISSYLARLFS